MNKAILDLARRVTGCRDPIAPKPKPISEPKSVEPLINKPDAGTICFDICKYWIEGGTPAIPICVSKDGSVNCKFQGKTAEPEPEPVGESVKVPDTIPEPNTSHFDRNNNTPAFGYLIDEEDKKRSMESKKSDQKDARDYFINLFKDKEEKKKNIYSEGIIIKEKYSLNSLIKKYSYLDELIDKRD